MSGMSRTSEDIVELGIELGIVVLEDLVVTQWGSFRQI